jgi:serine/threonine-protein kinase
MIPTSSERDLFLQHLQHSGLLTVAQLREITDKLGRDTGALDLARALVRAGTLTRFQARMLLQGRTDGFFLGPYRILELLGKGGMGRVYQAEHQTMKRTVALKVLSPSLMKAPKAQTFFQHEVQTAAQLHHPNIVQAYDANTVDGRYYLALEYIKGATLSQVVQQRGPLPIGLACEVIRQAALGLQYAHEQGLVHRDIKPANLMVAVVRGSGAQARERQLRAVILDFGLAQLARRRKRHAPNDSDSGRHPITGTPDYMSPEQARDRNQVDIRSDLYSLGCTFYYLLTGQAPFAGGGVLDKLIRHQSELPQAPERLRPRLRPAVAAIVLKLLAKDPADRFQTPQALAEALAPYASVPSHWQRRARRARRPAPAVTPADGTLGAGRDDTSPHLDLPPALHAEQEALSSWVAIRLDARRRQRRRLIAGAVALAGTLATAAVGWLLLMW